MFLYMQDQFFVENKIGRQSAKFRQIAKKSTSRMRNSLGMILMQNEKDRFIYLGRDAF